MADAPASSRNSEGPTHPEEMKATYNLRLGKSISLEATARITPAGIVTLGVTTLLVALAFAALAPSRRRH